MMQSPPSKVFLFVGCLLTFFANKGSTHAKDDRTLTVLPERVILRGPEATAQVLVLERLANKTIDRTREASLSVANPRVARVTSQGRVLARLDGRTELLVETEGQTTRIPVLVEGVRTPERVSFRHDIIPILSKAGCNSGACHGKAEGQNGFKLSIFGSDIVQDHLALVAESRGRRMFFAAPEQSLLVLKATGRIGHGGGQQVEPGSLWQRRLVRWIAEGARLEDTDSRAVEKIAVEPSAVMLSPGSAMQLRVSATERSGRVIDVTAEAEFQSNFDTVAKVDENGIIRVSDIPGGAAILVRYAGRVTTARVIVPRPGKPLQRPPEHNFIDKFVWDRLQLLNIEPSGMADDATFLRRAFLDVIGTLPTAAEARDFLEDKRPDKRKRLVDSLLKRKEYSQYWAMRWADLLHVDKDKITPQGAVAMTRWLEKQFAQNVPYDKFVRSILTARGNALAESPTSFYLAHKDAQALGRSISQTFLGVRLECAQCHHHPFGRWGQDDYFGFAGFFTGVAKKGKKIVPNAGSDLTNPRTKKPVPATALGAPPATFDGVGDRRTRLAEWMTSSKNPYFARMIANRLWAHYFGRGLVDPVDDVRATNPASNEPLLEALASHLVELDYDLAAFTRTMLASRTYQLSATPTESNALDEQNHSRAGWRPVPAEVLLDAICQTTGVPEEFNGWPRGFRAIQVWDNRMPSYFFSIFGRPNRLTSCACERGVEPSIAQALHLMNAPETAKKIRHRDGVAARLSRSKKKPEAIIEELYLAALARHPRAEETKLMVSAFDEADTRREAVEDVLWVLLNTKEFLFNH